ncbi:hypothetical protein DFJ74DRAFT_660392 [Hyaloraphidium curvatum]|nr:hypothetical protein DFJ74DRAFT_660392 [Hyaloraphidium curvatum]
MGSLWMPPEWAPHKRCWMAFPCLNSTFSDDELLAAARDAWSAVANAIARYEPVVMLARAEDVEIARSCVSSDVTVVAAELNDSWMRDIGPTFVYGPGIVPEEGNRQLKAVDWIFNGWGRATWANWDKDSLIGQKVAELAQAELIASQLVNEGGGIHVDGDGTVLLTETVQLDPQRNPGWTKEDVEREIHANLGTTKAIWVPRGLTKDYDTFGTKGHIDIVAAFVRPGVVVAHFQPNPEHPDHEVSKQVIEHLRSSTDAKGRKLEVIELLAPTVLRDEDGQWVDFSYVNHYVGNDCVILCAFDDPRDAEAAAILREQYPDRMVELLPARNIFAFGGGIHCITQQEPA